MEGLQRSDRFKNVIAEVESGHLAVTFNWMTGFWQVSSLELFLE